MEAQGASHVNTHALAFVGTRARARLSLRVGVDVRACAGRVLECALACTGERAREL